jgi:hypothetical protein
VKVNHSPPSSAEVKNAWSSTSPPTASLHEVDMAKLYILPSESIITNTTERLLNMYISTQKSKTKETESIKE